MSPDRTEDGVRPLSPQAQHPLQLQLARSDTTSGIGSAAIVAALIYWNQPESVAGPVPGKRKA